MKKLIVRWAWRVIRWLDPDSYQIHKTALRSYLEEAIDDVNPCDTPSWPAAQTSRAPEWALDPLPQDTKKFTNI